MQLIIMKYFGDSRRDSLDSRAVSSEILHGFCSRTEMIATSLVGVGTVLRRTARTRVVGTIRVSH
jgi:hypothetical protein